MLNNSGGDGNMGDRVGAHGAKSRMKGRPKNKAVGFLCGSESHTLCAAHQIARPLWMVVGIHLAVHTPRLASVEEESTVHIPKQSERPIYTLPQLLRDGQKTDQETSARRQEYGLSE